MPKLHLTFSSSKFQIYILGLMSFFGLSIITASPSIYKVDPASREIILVGNKTTLTSTSTLLPMLLDTIVETPEPPGSPTPTNTLKPHTPLPVFLPILLNQIPPTPTPTSTPQPQVSPTVRLYCSSPRIAIPDDDTTGITNNIKINDPGYILDLDVRIEVTHSWIGDLIFTLRHPETDTKITLIYRPGYPSTSNGCEQDGIITILDDEISSKVENKCASSPVAISGIYQPQEDLSTFIGQELSGTWKLSVSDNFQADTGILNKWCLATTTNPFSIIPTPKPTVNPPLPSAQINGIAGKYQAMPLDCETRSAVDWAAFYGVNINEFSFFNQLPKSDHPEIGFVGDPYDVWGQIPPNSYGVHAEPVANLLREHGLDAYTHKPLGWDGLRAEVTSGNPVIVWIVGSVFNGIPYYYSTNDGPLTIVAPFEHTVIVTGYTRDSVTYLSGSMLYTRSVEQFLDSWSVMGEMAITSHP